MSALEKLRDRMAELSDLSAIQMLAAWDQLVMMPAEGAPARAQQLGTLARLTHERSTGEEVGEWLAELDDAPLDGLDADVVRLARRDWERARRVPIELAAELAQASAQGQESWRGRARRMTSRPLRRHYSATSSWREPTASAWPSRARAPTTGCSATTTSASPLRTCAVSSRRSQRGSRRS